MTEKTVRLTGTTLEDDAGCPRQDNIAHLKIGDELKGSVESQYDDDFNETKWVVITDEDDAEIGDIRGLDSDLIIEAAKHGHIIKFSVAKLKETNLGKINVHVLVRTYTKKEAKKLAALGLNQ